MDFTLIPKISYGEKRLANTNLFDKIFLILAINNFSILVLRGNTMGKSATITVLGFGFGYWMMSINGYLRDKQLAYFDKSNEHNLQSSTYYKQSVNSNYEDNQENSEVQRH